LKLHKLKNGQIGAYEAPNVAPYRRIKIRPPIKMIIPKLGGIVPKSARAGEDGQKKEAHTPPMMMPKIL